MNIMEKGMYARAIGILVIISCFTIHALTNNPVVIVVQGVLSALCFGISCATERELYDKIMLALCIGITIVSFLKVWL